MNEKGQRKELSSAQLSKLSALKASFDRIADVKIDKKVGKGKGDTNSIRTQKATREVMHTTFRRLYDLGYQLEDVRNLQTRHVEKLVRDWHTNGVKPKTINNYLSIIRKCGGWMGKTMLVPASNALVFFLPNVDKTSLKVTTLARQSKSWSEQGIDVVEKIRQADAICIVFGAMLRLALAFGFRRKEQIKCVPSRIDGGTKVMLRGGITKSGRDRDIEIVDDCQRYALDHAKKIAGRGGRLGWPGKTYQQSVNHYNYLMGKKLGITGADANCVGHGLRAEFAENLALRLGFVPPTLGGSPSQMPSDAIKLIQTHVTEEMGHKRGVVTGAYYGSVRLKPREPGRKVCSLVIGDGLIATLHMNPTPRKDADGRFIQMSLAQRERTAVHLQIELDGSVEPAGIWRISGFADRLLQTLMAVDSVQRQLLSEKLRLVMGPMGWLE